MAYLIMILSLFSIVSIPYVRWKSDVVFLQEKGHLINCSLHTWAFWMKTFHTVRTFCFFFSLLIVLSWARGLIKLLVSLLLLGRIKLCLLFLLISFCIQSFGSSSKQRLIFRGYQDSHLHKLIILIGERFNECIQGRHLPIWNCKLLGMEGRHKNRVVWFKFQKYRKDEITVLVYFATRMYTNFSRMRHCEIL